MIRTIVEVGVYASALFGLAVLLGWRPGPRGWWDDRREEDRRAVNHIARCRQCLAAVKSQMPARYLCREGRELIGDPADFPVMTLDHVPRESGVPDARWN